MARRKTSSQAKRPPRPKRAKPSGKPTAAKGARKPARAGKKSAASKKTPGGGKSVPPPASTAARKPPGGGGRPIAEPLLEIDDIQGNILAGFSKDHQQLLALEIQDVGQARQWLARIEPRISSTAEVLQFNKLFKMRRARLGHDPNGLLATWANIAFSREGLAKLTSPADVLLLPDEAFRVGLPGRAGSLGDPIPPGSVDPTANWVVGGTGRVPDVLLIVASDSAELLQSRVDELSPGPADGAAAPKVLWREDGQTRPDLPGHEHFGFRDGVSQPGVRGLISRAPRVYLTPRLLKPPPPGQIEFSAPGQPLVWPGHFVLGYPTSDPNQNGQPVPPEKLGRPWFKNGSFLVFRRLNQNVAGFAKFLETAAAALSALPGLAGLSAERLGAILVGRWPSGAPLARATTADNPALAADSLANNDFLFDAPTPAPQFKPGEGTSMGSFPLAQPFVCPHAAHIFKTNPREVTTDLGPDVDTLTRRILRRGIPFGRPLSNPLQGDDGVERGLHFLCYQASITNQFEKLQQDWANNALAPTAGGEDVIIGQTPTQVRKFDIPASLSPSGGTLSAPTQWVRPTGGGYFFAPSLSALRHVLSGRIADLV